jgi:hypothetical protein
VRCFTGCFTGCFTRFFARCFASCCTSSFTERECQHRAFFLDQKPYCKKSVFVFSSRARTPPKMQKKRKEGEKREERQRERAYRRAEESPELFFLFFSPLCLITSGPIVWGGYWMESSQEKNKGGKKRINCVIQG